MQDEIVERVRVRAHEGIMPCIAAHAAAWETNSTPQEIGKALNDLGIRIMHCQLGLFGYGPKEEGKSKLIRPMPALDPDLKARLEGQAPNGVISCRACWEIADEFGVERLIVGNTADALGLRIMPCQLGCF